MSAARSIPNNGLHVETRFGSSRTIFRGSAPAHCAICGASLEFSGFSLGNSVFVT
jgi:hypothetical protein